jgi:ATP/ADP translocase
MFLSDLPWLLAISAAATIVIFPIVFFMSFVYDWLCEKHERTPKVLLMLLCAFLGVFVFALIAYAYVGLTLQQVLAATAGA